MPDKTPEGAGPALAAEAEQAPGTKGEAPTRAGETSGTRLPAEDRAAAELQAKAEASVHEAQDVSQPDSGERSGEEPGADRAPVREPEKTDSTESAPVAPTSDGMTLSMDWGMNLVILLLLLAVAWWLLSLVFSRGRSSTTEETHSVLTREIELLRQIRDGQASVALEIRNLNRQVRDLGEVVHGQSRTIGELRQAQAPQNTPADSRGNAPSTFPSSRGSRRTAHGYSGASPESTSPDRKILREARSAPPQTSEVASDTVSLLQEFNDVLSGGADSERFRAKWGPRSVSLENFNDRIRESAYAPELRLVDGSKGYSYEHFWLLDWGHRDTAVLLPAPRLIEQRVALRGPSAKKVFRSIFDTETGKDFCVRSVARVEVQGDSVHVAKPGRLEVPA